MSTESTSIFTSKTSWTVAVATFIVSFLMGGIRYLLPDFEMDPATEALIITTIASVLAAIGTAVITRITAWKRGKLESTVNGPTYPKVRP